MPSQYSVIDNKPIDQWKVVELREELRRRNLVTKGLKEELVKRLDEAIKKELESENEKESGNGGEHILDPQNDTREEDPSLEVTDGTQTTLEEDNITDKDAAIVNISHGVLVVNQGHETQNGDAIEFAALAGKLGEMTAITGDLVGSVPGNQNFTGQSGMQCEDDGSEKFDESNSPFVLIDEKASTGDLEGSALVNQSITVQSGTLCVDANLKEMFEESKIPIIGSDEKEATTCDLDGSALVKQNITVQSDTQGCDSDLKEIFKAPTVGADEKAATAGDFEGSAPFNQNTTLSSTQGEDAVPREKFEESKPVIMESTVIQPEQHNQVSEVSQDLGFQVKYKSNSTDSVSINEKNFIKDNLTADHFPLELVVKQDVVQPSSSSCPAGGGHSCMVVDEQETAKDHATDEHEAAKDHTTDEQEAAKDHATDEQEGFEHQDLGFQVKYKSNSTDSVSIDEKNYIKDSLTDHFPLELVIKQDVVQPSSSSCPAGGGHSCMVVDEQEAAKDHTTVEQEAAKDHATDEQEAAKDHATDEQEGFEHQVFGGQEEINTGYAANEQYVESMVEDHLSLDDNDMKNASSFEAPKKEDCVESGSPEKLNLDRSSGDESMEEDILDIKHMETDIKSEEPTSKIDANTSDIKLEERATGMGKSSSEMKEIDIEDVKHASLIEKRKLEDVEVVVNNGAPKRHRRWNPDIIKVPEQQIPLHDISVAPKNNLQLTLRRTFSRSNSTISMDSPKERIVPTPKKPATTSLRIDNFLRPFTLKAVQELLGKTGRVCDFWMDHIKTHCYVTFSSVEEATETRNAVYNLQWPPNGGRFLAADFVDPQEVKLRLAAAAPPPSLAAISSSQAPPSQQTHAAQPTHHQNLRTQPQAPSQQTLAPQPILQQNLRAQLPPPPPLSGHLPPPPPPLSLPLPNTAGLARERLPPPPPKKPEPPVMTLDDLFKKTRATPRIYYLPLTEEQASAKVAAQQSKRTQL